MQLYKRFPGISPPMTRARVLLWHGEAERAWSAGVGCWALADQVGD